MQDLVIQGYLSYPHLFQARQIKGQGAFKYGVNVILPPNFDWAPFQQAYQEALVAKWPTGAPAGLADPWEQVTEGPYAGHMQIKTGTVDDTSPPQVVMQNPTVKAGPHQQGSFFPGALCNVYIRVHGYDTMNIGVRCNLNAVQLVSDDPGLPRLDNQKNAAEVFQTVPGGPAATAGVAGQPAGFPAGAGQPQGQGQPADPAAGGYGVPGGYQQPTNPGQVAGQPGQGMPVQPQGMPVQQQHPGQMPQGQPAQGMPGAGVATGAPQGQPVQGQPGQGMPWNQ